MEDFKWIGPLVAALGPAAFAFALVAGILFFFYRRDILSSSTDSRADRTDLMVVVAKNTQSTDKLTEAVGRLTEASIRQSEANGRQIETIVRAFERRSQDRR